MVSRRRRTAYGLLGLAIVSTLVLAGVLLWLTQTESGRNRIVNTIVTTANGAFEGRGRLVIGELRSTNPRSIDARNVQLVDSAGVPILTVSRMRARLGLRAMLGGLVHISSMQLDTVRLDLAADFTGPFNLQYLLLGDPDRPPSPPRAQRLGDDVFIDEVVLRNGTIVVTLPWEPHESFVGSERDSVIAYRDSTSVLIRREGGLLERRTITIRHLAGHDLHALTADDSPGRMVIDTADLDVSEPPVTVRDVQGDVVWYDDSLTFDAGRVMLPDSRLAAAGVIKWGQEGPVRYDVNIDGADVALSDINWTWPLLPMEGRATAQVRMRTLENPDHLEVALTALEASAMQSSVSGEVAMVVEPRDFLLHDVALSFDPMSTALAARLTEELLPPELDGRITGRFVAREGGSLDALRIDTLQLAFDDATTPGARSRVRASGVVAIGVNPTAQDLRFTDLFVDLRTVRTVVPDLPEMVNGSVSGRGRLASVSLESADVRDLTLQWTDNEGHVSAVTGRSAVRWGGGDYARRCRARVRPGGPGRVRAPRHRLCRAWCVARLVRRQWLARQHAVRRLGHARRTRCRCAERRRMVWHAHGAGHLHELEGRCRAHRGLAERTRVAGGRHGTDHAHRGHHARIRARCRCAGGHRSRDGRIDTAGRRGAHPILVVRARHVGK